MKFIFIIFLYSAMIGLAGESPDIPDSHGSMLNKATSIKLGMSEPEVRKVLNGFEFSGVLGSNTIYSPAFAIDGKPMLKMIVFFRRSKDDEEKRVVGISDIVSISHNGKNYQYSITMLKETE